ncbi:MAG: FAD-dependent oxidoreductase [Chloroflexi bacterium]|nr:FAD-dependent oxidoreductase [Chloroflexota bacterium]MDA1271855.1 FAD-dependent oxidoreductase [Chloroflexota bacterium]
MVGSVQDSSLANTVSILGAGPAGLACGWALEELGHRDYSIFEKSSAHGGNARTVEFGEFRYDTGPHRFHERNPEATRRISELMGPELHEVAAPARICWQGRFVDFPLRPTQILMKGGLRYTARATKDLVASRLKHRGGSDETPQDFSSYARARFGKTIAETFLIPFSERLWGLPGSELSPDIAGRRLPGFSLRGMIKEAFLGSKNPDHLEGRFLYPRLGYGQISDKMADRLSSGALRYRHQVVGIETLGNEVAGVAVETGGAVRQTSPGTVINTLPISTVAQMMAPRPPQEVMDAAACLRFRDVLLVAIFIDQESISDAAVTYFQDREHEFTRAHEPRNRSRAMSPEGKTSLVVEFPCFRGDAIWDRDETRLVAGLVQSLEKMGLVKESRVTGYDVHRLRNAYPVYFKGYGAATEVVLSYLRRFENLRTLGRGGSYFYGHVHDFVSDAFKIAAEVDRFSNAKL